MATMSDSSSTTVLQTCKWICNTLCHQCIAVLAIYAIWVPIQSYSNPFSWHVILSTLGILPLMAEALILFSSDNVWSQGISRKTKYWIHGILISVASLLVITGVALEIDRKEKSPYNLTHFTSEHAITGLISMIFIIAALICGPLAFTSSAFKTYARPVWFKFVHNILGQLGFIIGLVSLILGYHISWFAYFTSEGSRILATVVTVLVGIWSLIVAGQSSFNQFKSILHR